MRRINPLPVSLNRARSGPFNARKEARLYRTLSLLLDHDWLNKRSMHEELCREEAVICLIMIGGTKGPCISARALTKKDQGGLNKIPMQIIKSPIICRATLYF